SLKTGRNTISVNWDAWQDVGLATRKAEWFKTANYRNVDHPLLGECVDESVDRKEYLTKYSVDNFWTLDEHRIAGHALLPGTAYLEIARAAFEDHAQTDAMELTDVCFLNILHLGDRELKETHTVLEKNGSDFKFVVKSQTNGGEQQHAVGKVAPIPPATAQTHDLQAIRERCGSEVSRADCATVMSELGPRWQSLQSLYLGNDELFALIELPEEFSGDLEKYKLHPAIIDVVTGVAKQYLADGGSYLPLSY